MIVWNTRDPSNRWEQLRGKLNNRSGLSMLLASGLGASILPTIVELAIAIRTIPIS